MASFQRHLLSPCVAMRGIMSYSKRPTTWPTRKDPPSMACGPRLERIEKRSRRRVARSTGHTTSLTRGGLRGASAARRAPRLLRAALVEHAARPAQRPEASRRAAVPASRGEMRSGSVRGVQKLEDARRAPAARGVPRRCGRGMRHSSRARAAAARGREATCCSSATRKRPSASEKRTSLGVERATAARSCAPGRPGGSARARRTRAGACLGLSERRKLRFSAHRSCIAAQRIFRASASARYRWNPLGRSRHRR